MENLLRKEKILVTGGTGYLASWIIKYLLDEGYAVNTTVRDLQKQSFHRHLTELSEIHPGKLTLYEAELMKEGSFDGAVTGCSVVIHTASPFRISGVKDAMKELVMPAVQGVRNVFESAVRAGTVHRIILTSSAAAISGGI
jgi:nucleoside-diphosphate-sugar epimerase